MERLAGLVRGWFDTHLQLDPCGPSKMSYTTHLCESRSNIKASSRDRPSNQILRGGSDKSAGGRTAKKRLDTGVVGHGAGKIFKGSPQRLP